MRLIDLTGQVFGRLTVLGRGPNKSGRAAWDCLCLCGRRALIGGEPLRYGQSRSCGCLGSGLIGPRSRKHGHTVSRRPSPEYRAWQHAKARCQNPNDHKYKLYGGRGITMDPTWVEDFEAFYQDMGPRPNGHTLDRIDVNGPYAPNNCRWATPQIQGANRRDVVEVVEWCGRRMILKDVARATQVNYKRLHYLHRTLGKPLSEAVAQAR